jgi:site-specific DNA-methyltransferase (adenine-specific)
LAFSHSRTSHRQTTAIEDAGFEIRDTIMWLYSGFPKSHNVSKTTGKEEWNGWGTALKPAYEPVVMARKPLEGSVAENVLKWKTGAINIDACRIGEEEITINRWSDGSKPFGNGAGHPYKTVSVTGRWPANVILDEETGKALDSQMEGASRFFYCPKVNKKERNAGCDKNDHPTVKPIALMEYLIKLVTRQEHTVLDPFMGSGSTGMAAKRLGRNFIGIEREEAYFEIAKARLKTST